MIRVAIEPTFDAFRDAARALASRGVPPSDILWEDTSRGQAGLFGGEAPGPEAEAPEPVREVRVPRAFRSLAELAVLHADPERFALLYRLLFRLGHGEAGLLEVASDSDVAELRAKVQAVRHEEHAMHAFVRFRRVALDDREHYVAFYRPEHQVLERVAAFFARRFPEMPWSILTPERSAHWGPRVDPAGGNGLRFVMTFGPGATRERAHAGTEGDAIEELFRTYYANIYNPARVNLDAMQGHLPAKRWRDLPELSVLPSLVRASSARVSSMMAPKVSASESFLPAGGAKGRVSLSVLREAAAGCRACDLCEVGTQTVFGEGPAHAGVMFVGEQPGDEEDRLGRPFVGPAGRVLDAALKKAGIDRQNAYVTNAVKHFKWEPRGKRRLHKRPDQAEVVACRGWLDAELALVKPKVIVALGATAGASFFGSKFRITRVRGQVLETPWAPALVPTYHPSALLRMPDEAARAEAQRHFEEDLAQVERLLR